MSTRLDVLLAVKRLVEGALPGARVLGLDGNEAAPAIIPATGMVVVRSGDPGEPVEITLSPATYWFEHAIPLEVSAFASGALTSEQALDVMLGAIGEAVVADRTLAGLCNWIDVSSAGTDDIYAEGGGRPPRGAPIMIMATYSTTNPLA